MFDRFTDRAKKVMSFARQEAMIAEDLETSTD